MNSTTALLSYNRYLCDEKRIIQIFYLEQLKIKTYVLIVIIKQTQFLFLKTFKKFILEVLNFFGS